jgi:hypothetical protein
MKDCCFSDSWFLSLFELELCTAIGGSGLDCLNLSSYVELRFKSPFQEEPVL